jgi:hypothetical protein
MKAFLWKDLEKMSSNYHSGGSILIEAPTLERARELAVYKDYDNVENPIKGVDKEPNAVFESSGETEKVWAFPDAGCC